MPAMTTPTDRLPFTGDDEADRLLVDRPLALLIGFALDQQVTVQKAFSGPLELQRRLGHLDAARIAAIDPAELDRVFRTPPALHRFPGCDGRQGPGAVRARSPTDYGNDAGRIWTEADGRRGPRAAAARPAGDRRDEGRSDPGDPRQALRRRPARLRTRCCRRTRRSATWTRAEALADLPGRQAGQKAAAREAAKG